MKKGLNPMLQTVKKGSKQPPMGATKWLAILNPWLWMAPAIVSMGVLLFYPLLNTIWLSFFSNDLRFIRLTNYASIFTNAEMLEILRNNVLWLILGTILTVFSGTCDGCAH